MPLTSTEIYKKCKDSIVGILTNIDGKYYLGTGFFIRSDTIATAAHNLFTVDYQQQTVIKASEVILTITNYDLSGKTRVIKIDKFFIDGAADIGVIKVPSIKNQPVIEMDYSKTPDVGETCYLIGNPAGIDFQSICRGIVRNPKHIYESNNIETILLDISGMQGNSGSPILNTEGKSIGIFTYGFSSEESRMGGGPSIDYCKPSLNWMMNRNKDYVEKRNSGILLWETVQSKDFINKQFDDFDICGIKILYLADYSPFKKIGLREGDVIIELDGKKIGFYANQSHFNNVLWGIRKNVRMNVKFVRNNNYNRVLERTVFLNISYDNFSIMDNYDYMNYLYTELEKVNRKNKKDKNGKKINNNKNREKNKNDKNKNNNNNNNNNEKNVDKSNLKNGMDFQNINRIIKKIENDNYIKKDD